MHPEWQAFLIEQGAVVNAGEVTAFAESAAAQGTTQMVDLSHLGSITAEGEDAASFLQGQTTNDTVALPGGAAQWNGYCSPKGRLLASFLLWRLDIAVPTFRLQLPLALVEPIRKRLSLYVLRAKLRLEDTSQRLLRFGLIGSGAAELVSARYGAAAGQGNVLSVWQGTGLEILRLGPDRFEIVATFEAARAAWTTFATQATPSARNAWDLHDIRAGIVNVLPETQEAFVPQMANLDHIGAISFKKGCYTGQEIVARTQYRGILKRRMVRALVTSDRAPLPGEKVFSPAFDSQAVGEIANVARAPDGGYEVLAVAQIDALDDLHLRSAQGIALQRLPLPYALA